MAVTEAGAFEVQTGQAMTRDQVMQITVNARHVSLELSGVRTLLSVLRHDLGLTGTKLACGVGECGACTVLVDGKPVNSCVYLAIKADGRKVETIEGMADEGDLSPLQQAFVSLGGFQCGFCTPGQVMRAVALLRTTPIAALDADTVRREMAGNICRCTGYDKIVEAVLAAGHEVSEGANSV